MKASNIQISMIHSKHYSLCATYFNVASHAMQHLHHANTACNIHHKQRLFILTENCLRCKCSRRQLVAMLQLLQLPEHCNTNDSSSCVVSSCVVCSSSKHLIHFSDYQPGQYYLMTLSKFFTFTCLCHQAV